MSGLEQKIDELQLCIKELQLDAHASRIAITVLSSALNSISGKPGHLAEVIEDGMALSGPMQFDFPVEKDYETKLNAKVLALLSKQN
ncbi:hypothetical protein FH968_20555 [Buttiauxella sp. B2]|uniref:hypothetical protein n=1 Tax=Buttiauxella sp. B2 TaxID=2587812 RepID=UPI00111F8697|nr:hypothetical protein [Buttiauxella sp. B2]TNV14918.1 hypothetical protein FH968_20555 [Buttiauxella sp. B2]